MYYYLIIALQIFCVYHVIKTHREYYWIFLIIFLPLIGCVIYIITQVFNKRDVEKLNAEVTSIVNPTRKVRDLEKALEFADTFQNKVNLADAYLEIKDHGKAIALYESALEGNFQNDFYVIKQLVNASYGSKEYEAVIRYAEMIKDAKEFVRSREQFLYGLALDQTGKPDEAEEQLRYIDQRYSFYEERLMFAKFLIKRGKEAEAKEVVNEIYSESQHMTKPNKRKYRTTIAEVRKLRETL